MKVMAAWKSQSGDSDAVRKDEVQLKIKALRRDYAGWRKEHRLWLDELARWRQDQDRLEALLYKLEHILDEEEREFEALMNTIETHEKLLNANEKTLEFYLEQGQIKEDSFDHLIKAHAQQRRWERKLHKLHDRLKGLHTSVLDDLSNVLEHRPQLRH